jgi:predicted transcriptional regulator
MSRITQRHQDERPRPAQQPAPTPARGLPHPDASDRTLGEREREVLGILWKYGSSTVQQVASRLSVSLAYTTVMTTLDRLFKKGVARREKHDRAFLYSAALTEEEMESKRASDLVQHFLENSSNRHNLLLSHFVDAVHRYDTRLLTQLEEEIRSARSRRRSPAQGQETP